jgi:hypothetical protein
VFWLLSLALGFGAVRVSVGWGLLALIPLGTVFHGILLLFGIHPKDFYAWWGNLSDLTKSILGALLAILVVGVLIFMFVFN